MAGSASTPTRARPAVGATTNPGQAQGVALTPVDGHEPASCIEVVDLRRSFGQAVALDGISLLLRRGQIHALLGPNGAGKTTLLRILSGLLSADSGSVRLMDVDVTSDPRQLRGRVGLVPAGDRTFYLRLSGLENLAFFARLQGIHRKQAYAAARRSLAAVGLADSASKRVGFYSHGMQKRLSVARALLANPPVLLVDEATHDLDPDGAVRIRELIATAADEGASVIWATQRLDEIRAFAETVTLLDRGCVRFAGSVNELTQFAEPRHYLLSVDSAFGTPRRLDSRAAVALGELGACEFVSRGNTVAYRLTLAEGTGIGEAIVRLEQAGMRVITCRQERSEIEEAFLALTTAEPA